MYLTILSSVTRYTLALHFFYRQAQPLPHWARLGAAQHHTSMYVHAHAPPAPTRPASRAAGTAHALPRPEPYPVPRRNGRPRRWPQAAEAPSSPSDRSRGAWAGEWTSAGTHLHKHTQATSEQTCKTDTGNPLPTHACSYTDGRKLQHYIPGWSLHWECWNGILEYYYCAQARTKSSVFVQNLKHCMPC